MSTKFPSVWKTRKFGAHAMSLLVTSHEHQISFCLPKHCFICSKGKQLSDLYIGSNWSIFSRTTGVISFSSGVSEVGVNRLVTSPFACFVLHLDRNHCIASRVDIICDRVPLNDIKTSALFPIMILNINKSKKFNSPQHYNLSVFSRLTVGSASRCNRYLLYNNVDASN